MARHRSNENVCNLEFHHIQTSASKKVMITVSDPFPLMWQYLDRQQLQTFILVITSSAMRVEKLSKAIWFISSGVTTKMLKSVWLFHGKSVRRSDAGREGGIESVDWGIRILHPWRTSQRQIINLGFIMEALRKLNVSSSYRLRMREESQISQRAFRGFTAAPN